MNERRKISVTQIDQLRRCQREYAYQRVFYLPKKPFAAKAYGDVLHSVCERFFEADDLGEVDLFPDGWHIVESWYGDKLGEPRPEDPTKVQRSELTADEQVQMRKLVEEAIRDGVLVRRPGRQVEYHIESLITEIDGVEYYLDGFVDVAYPETCCLEDNKSSKKSSYLKSKTPGTKKFLGDDLQCLAYAKALMLELAKAGKDIPETITFRHNQFIKDKNNPRVKTTDDVEVSRDRVESEWDAIQADVRMMHAIQALKTDRYLPGAAKIRRRMLDGDEKALGQWQVLEKGIAEAAALHPIPANTYESCEAYGGCAYKSICYNGESLTDYVDRMERLRINQEELNTLSKGTDMGLMDKINATRKEQAKKNPAVEAPKEEPKPEPEPKDVPSTAPWYNTSCTTCTAGLDSQYRPCKSCQILNASAGNGIDPEEYAIDTTGDGNVIIRHRDTKEVFGSFSHDAVQDERAALSSEPAPTESEPVQEDMPAEEDASIVRPVETTLTVYINCIPQNVETVSGPEVMSYIRGNMRGMSFFEQRDQIQADPVGLAEEVVAVFGRQPIVFAGLGAGETLERVVVDALSVYEDTLIVRAIT